MIPRNPTQPSKKLGLSSFLSCAPSMNPPPLSISRLSLSHSVPKSSFSLHTKARREVLVRAEDNPEGEAVDDANAATEGNVDDVVETSEAKAPRKPRVKLGDVMGVSYERDLVS